MVIELLTIISGILIVGFSFNSVYYILKNKWLNLNFFVIDFLILQLILFAFLIILYFFMTSVIHFEPISVIKILLFIYGIIFVIISGIFLYEVVKNG